jgi:hypothetical protein
LAIEQNWAESLEIMRRPAVDEQTLQPSLAAMIHVSSYRRKEVCSVMKVILKVLDAHTEEDSETTQKRELGSTTVIATALPDSVKSRLCYLLDRITTVLLAATRQLTSFIRAGQDQDLPAVTESLACLTAWLVSSAQDNPDFIARSRRWYQAEGQQKRPTNSSGATAFERLPRMLFRMEELERRLQRLHRMLAMLENKSSEAERVRKLDLLLDEDDEALDNPASLVRMIKDKVTSLTKQDAFGMMMTDSSLGSKKRQKQNHEIDTRIRKERRRGRVVRSRNQLVDEWLHLDQENDEGDDGDAFVDLEDFLVEG